MIKKTIEISTGGTSLSSNKKQLLIRREGLPEATIPCEDIQLVLLDAPKSLVSYGALAELLANNATMIVCGRNHLPAGLLIPVSGHTQVINRLQLQINCKKPLQKQIWKTLIQKKIYAQGALLQQPEPANTRLRWLAAEVRSGDPENHEGQAAAVFWKNWLGENHPFRRNPDGDGINALLNYGYSALRALIARACILAGLLPALGIHHHNRSNAFCLADDLIEPLRPMVDSKVIALVHKGKEILEPETKKALLSLLEVSVSTGNISGPLSVQIHNYVGSFVRSIQEGADCLEVPSWNFQVTGSCG